MRNAGHTAIKAIVLMGVVTVIFLLIASMGLKRAMLKGEEGRVNLPPERFSPFESDRAWRDLEGIVSLGPRYPGSPGMEAQRDYLRAELADAGFSVNEQPFTAQGPNGPVPMRNLSVTIPGDGPGILVLCTHYDTWRAPDFDFIGANSGGSGTAWLLETARSLGPETRNGATLRLAWLDGIEPLGPDDNGNHGATALAPTLDPEATAVLYIDMVGDCLLRIRRDAEAPDWLEETVWDTAQRLRYRRQFGTPAPDAPGAHLALRAAGIPALGLVDFSYGGTVSRHRELYHRQGDTLDAVCAESLRAVADVIYHALPILDGELQKRISVNSPDDVATAADSGRGPRP